MLLEKQGIEQRHQGRPLSPRRHIRRPVIGHHGHAPGGLQSGCISNGTGASTSRLVIPRMAREPHQMEGAEFLGPRLQLGSHVIQNPIRPFLFQPPNLGLGQRPQTSHAGRPRVGIGELLERQPPDLMAVVPDLDEGHIQAIT